MFSNAPKFTVGPAPHWRSRTSITGMNAAFILALLPAALAGCLFHAFGPNNTALTPPNTALTKIIEGVVKSLGMDAGLLWLAGSLGLVILGLGLGMLVEYLCQVMMRQTYNALDGHGALMGMILAMLMPPTVPWWVFVIGIVVTIFVGKQIFGGIGGYPMHPAVVGWLVILLSWSNHIYPVGMASIAAIHPVVVMLTAAGGLFLVALGHVRWQIPCGTLLGMLGAYFLFQENLDGDFVDQLLMGHVALAAFFIATDSTSSPANKTALWLYGIGLGVLILLIRAYGAWADAVPFAVILMNVMNPLLDRIRPRVKQVVTHG